MREFQGEAMFALGARVPRGDVQPPSAPMWRVGCPAGPVHAGSKQKTKGCR
jgi:hypothetical protein